MTSSRGLWGNSPFRRLVFLIAWLALADCFVPSVTGRLERARYESNLPFRFEDSDLFGLGPVVDYVRDVPKGPRPRSAFLGNSVIFGYGLESQDTLPAAFQTLVPDHKVLNLALNGLETGGSFLITKEIIDSVDILYVLLSVKGVAFPNLAQLITVDEADRRRFNLPPTSVIESAVQHSLGFWRLYATSYRIQQASFNSSTRRFLYRNKAAPLRALGRSSSPAPLAPAALSDAPGAPTRIEVTHPMAEAPPAPEDVARLAARHPLLWDFAQLVVAHDKRVVFLDFIGYWKPLPVADCATFNAHFGPRATVVQIAVPRSARWDSQHLTSAGSRAVAHALYDRLSSDRVDR